MFVALARWWYCPESGGVGDNEAISLKPYDKEHHKTITTMALVLLDYGCMVLVKHGMVRQLEDVPGKSS